MKTFTVEQRDECRARCLKRHGFDPCISEATADELRALIAQHWVIVGEEFSGMSLHFHVNLRSDISSKRRLDCETAMSRKYGNDPFRYATDFSNYRLTFVVT